MSHTIIKKLVAKINTRLAKRPGMAALTLLSLIILLPTTLLLGLYFFNPNSAVAWYNDHWSYRQRIPISNTSGIQATNHQLQLTLDIGGDTGTDLIADGKVKADCSDIRFTNQAGEELKYWIEPGTCDSDQALVWVLLPSLPASGGDIFWYYGNPSAYSKSNAEGVFLDTRETSVVTWPLQESAALTYAVAHHIGVSEGRQLVLNHEFDAAEGWTLGDGWSINNGLASSDGSQTSVSLLEQNIAGLTDGKQVTLIISVTNHSAGTLQVYQGDASTPVRTILPPVNPNATFFYTNHYATQGPFLAIAASDDFVGDILSISVTQQDIPDSDTIDSTINTQADGDMEAGDTSAWQSVNGATLSKQTINPHGGLQVLRITDPDPSGGGARQFLSLEFSSRYRAVGVARSDGSSIPSLKIDENYIWTGSNTTDWQAFDVVFDSGVRAANFEISGGGGGYVEFDDIAIYEISPMAGIPSNGVLQASNSSGHLDYAYSFDGNDDFVNIHSSDLNSVFNPMEGTLVAWAEVANSGVWTDGSIRSIVRLAADSENEIAIEKNSANNTLDFKYRANNILDRYLFSSPAPTDFFQVVLTWDAQKEELKAYFNGEQVGTTQVDLGEWLGNLSTTDAVIGAYDTTGNSSWNGQINDVRLYDRALSAEEIATMYSDQSDIQIYQTPNDDTKEYVANFNTQISQGSLGTEEVGPSPAAYWSFDEGNGQTVNDDSGNDNHGTLGANSSVGSDDPIWANEDQCISGKCLYFDRANQTHVAIGNPQSLNFGTGAFSVSFWAKSHDVGDAFMGLVSKGGFPDGFELRFFQVGLIRSISGYIGNLPLNTGGLKWQPDVWHHISFSRDTDGDWVIYKDGKQVASGNNPTSLGSSNWEIGRMRTNLPFTGFIDEVKIYPYARSAEEVKQDFLVGAAQAGSGAVLGAADTSFLNNGLVGYWPMDEASGTVVKDKSGNNNDGSLIGAQETGTGEAAGTTTTLVDVDNTDLSIVNDTYNGMILVITGGGSCSITPGEQRLISDYTGPTKTITIAPAFTAQTDSCAFEIRHQVGGKFGGGVSLDGSGEAIETADDPYDFGTENFTLATWVKLQDNTDQPFLIDNRGTFSGANAGYSFLYHLGRLKLRLGDGTNGPYEFEGSNSLNSDTWHHVVAVVDRQNNEVSLYLDGKLELEPTLINSNLGDISNIHPTKFGTKSIGDSANGLLGTLDEVRIYNRALSPGEVKALHEWAPRPVGYWTFDDSVGATAKDSSGNNNDGSLTNMNDDDWIQGKVGGALEFDGVDDEVDIGNAEEVDRTHPLTVSAWVKASPGYLGSDRSIVASHQGNDRQYWLDLSNAGEARFCVYNSAEQEICSTTSQFSADEWYYLTGVYNGTDIILHSNGTEVDRITAGNLLNSLDSQELTLGNGFGNDFLGMIDEVKIYDYARTQQQILQDMRGSANSVLGAQTTGGMPEPVAHWSFDEGSGQIINDSIGDTNGTLGANSSSGNDDPSWRSNSSGECHRGGCLAFDGGDGVLMKPLPRPYGRGFGFSDTK